MVQDARSEGDPQWNCRIRNGCRSSMSADIIKKKGDALRGGKEKRQHRMEEEEEEDIEQCLLYTSDQNTNTDPQQISNIKKVVTVKNVLADPEMCQV